MTNDRRFDLDRAKGLGIFLVVLGHIVARDFPEGNDWFKVLYRTIYSFHMPFFMYLSGYVFFFSGASRQSSDRWVDFLRKRAVRLLLPFLVFGVVTIFGKTLLGHLIHVDNPPRSIPDAFANLLWHTSRSPATSVWYIAVLFVYCCITLPLLKVCRNRTYMLAIAAVVLFFIPLPPIGYLDRVGRFYVFFLLGGLAAEREEAWLRHVDRFLLPWIAAFALALIAAYAYRETIPRPWSFLLCGILSMPSLHGAVRRLTFWNSLMMTLGTYSFVIYLLNTIAIGLTKGILLKVHPWDGIFFLAYAPVLLVSGLLLPILLKKTLFPYFPRINRLTN